MTMEFENVSELEKLFLPEGGNVERNRSGFYNWAVGEAKTGEDWKGTGGIGDEITQKIGTWEMV